MIKMLALYKQPKDPAAFEKYYFETHKPIAEKIPGLAGFRCFRIIGAAGGRSSYYFAAELCFLDRAAFKAGVSSTECAATAADLENFAPGLCEVMFAEETDAPLSGR